MTLTMTRATLGSVSELMQAKADGFDLPPFPGYTDDQWGIKAHNRAWIHRNCDLPKGARLAEIGGAYSSLPATLAEGAIGSATIIDDFGGEDGDLWARWGDPREFAANNPGVDYVFARAGDGSIPAEVQPFDLVYTVSTLEHVPPGDRLAALQEMNRLTKAGGRQLHCIDVAAHDLSSIVKTSFSERLPGRRRRALRRPNTIWHWIEMFRLSGVDIACPVPSSISLLRRETLVESVDVVYRFYPPRNSPKRYMPAATLLIEIEDL